MKPISIYFDKTLAFLAIVLALFATAIPAFAEQAATAVPSNEKKKDEIGQLTSNSLGERLAEARRQAQLLSLKRIMVSHAESQLSSIQRDAGDTLNDGSTGKLDPMFEAILKDLKQLDKAVKALDMEQQRLSNASANPPVTAATSAVPQPVDMSARVTGHEEHSSPPSLPQKQDSLSSIPYDLLNAIRTSAEKLTPVAEIERRIASRLEQIVGSISRRVSNQDEHLQNIERDLNTLELQVSAISSMAMSGSLGNAIPVAAAPLTFGLPASRGYLSPSPSRPFSAPIPFSATEWLPPLSESYSTDFVMKFPQLSLLYRLVERRGWSTEAERVEEVVQAAKSEVSNSSLFSPQRMTSDDHPIGRRIKSVRESISEIKTKNNTEDEDLRKRTADTETEFLRRDSDLNQNQINLKLISAVYMMIYSITLAILCLFAVVLVYKDGNFSRWILKDRVLIELLSMGFLLLTIIILGTARILDAQGLSALLGTISGYIFIRKASEVAGAGNDNLAASPPPIDVSSNKIQINAQVISRKIQVGFTSSPVVVDGVNIYSRLKGENTWKLLARCSKSPYEDDRALTNANVPEDREYSAYGVLGDKEIGQRSNIASVRLEP